MSYKSILVVIAAAWMLPVSTWAQLPAAPSAPAIAAAPTVQAGPTAQTWTAAQQKAAQTWSAAQQKAAQAAAKSTVNYDETAVPPYTLEDPLRFADGRKGVDCEKCSVQQIRDSRTVNGGC